MKTSHHLSEVDRQVQVHYSGFHPSEYISEYVDGLMKELYEEAPYGSNLRAHISKRGDLFKAVVSIHSSAGPFFAAASSPSLRGLAGQLFERAHRRIQKWKSQRFRSHRKSARQNWQHLSEVS